MNQGASPKLQMRVDSACHLFSEHGTAIYAMILLHVNDKTQADDLYQDLFLSLVEKPMPENLDAPLAYLWRLIANDVKNSMRKRTRSKSMQNKQLPRLSRKSYNRQALNALDIMISKRQTPKACSTHPRKS